MKTTKGEKHVMSSKKKQDKKEQPVKLHLLSELTERVTRDMRRAAMEEYLNGETHRQMLLAEPFAEQCDKSRKRLLKGEIAPHLDICCCGGTFQTILTAQTDVIYKGCELPEYDCFEEDEEGESGGDGEQLIREDVFDALNSLSADELHEQLISTYECREEEYYHLHNDDTHNRDKFRTAVHKRFEAAAQYAKAIGSESARLWMEAICLLQPRPPLMGGVYHGFGPYLIADCVKQAYEVAERAQRMLWVDNELRKLAPVQLAPKKSPKKGR